MLRPIVPGASMTAPFDLVIPGGRIAAIGSVLADADSLSTAEARR